MMINDAPKPTTRIPLCAPLIAHRRENRGRWIVEIWNEEIDTDVKWNGQ